MGIAGATLLPSALAVLGELVDDPKRRARAIGIFAAGFAIGPVLGGVLIERFWWGSVFLVDLPVIALFLVVPRLLLLLPTAATGGIDWYVASTAIAGAGYASPSPSSRTRPSARSRLSGRVWRTRRPATPGPPSSPACTRPWPQRPCCISPSA